MPHVIEQRTRTVGVQTIQGAVLSGPRHIRFEEREAPRIVEPTDAILRLSATCICGSDLWPYRGISPVAEPTPMGHEYCGIVEEVGKAVKSLRPGQFVIGSFATSAYTLPHCPYGYQSSCVVRCKRLYSSDLVKSYVGFSFSKKT